MHLTAPGPYQGFVTAERAATGVTASTSQCFHRTVQQAVCRQHGGGRGPRRQVTRMMPIGVPRVPYKSQQGWLWVDIWNCMYRDRIMFLNKPVNAELGNQLVATMLYLDTENKRPITMYINCSGGDLVPCLGLYDTMKYIGSDVSTVGFGGCMGMSGFLLAVGKKGKRYALPNTRIMLHHPSGTARGTAADIHTEAKELLRLRSYVNNTLALATNQPLEKVQFDFNRNKYFNTDEALQYGIIDKVVAPPKANMFGSG